MDKDVFKDNSQYVRDALVASTFEDIEIDISANKRYLLKIINNSLKDNH